MTRLPAAGVRPMSDRRTLRTASHERTAVVSDADSDPQFCADVHGPRIQASFATYKVLMK